MHLRKVLLCSDFSECSEKALQYALSLATEYQSELSLVHVMEHATPHQERDGDNERILRRLEECVPHDARSCCQIRPVVRTGRAYEEIVKLAAEEQTDLIVVGVRGRNVLDLALFGSTTHRVLQLGPCPVLAIHA